MVTWGDKEIGKGPEAQWIKDEDKKIDQKPLIKIKQMGPSDTFHQFVTGNKKLDLKVCEDEPTNVPDDNPFDLKLNKEAYETFNKQWTANTTSKLQPIQQPKEISIVIPFLDTQ